MNVLIAPDSFKGSLSATIFCRVASDAILSVIPDAKVVSVPMSDGGDGMVETLLNLSEFSAVEVNVSNPVGHSIRAHYAYSNKADTAVIEMASASGLALLKVGEYDALHTSTIGTGMLIQHALDQGVSELIIGLGGSATTDAGIGCLSELGFQFLDKTGKPVSLSGKGLLRLDSIVAPSTDFSKLKVRIACDVSNPLFGEIGAAQIFAPQKGASLEEVEILDQGLINFSLVVQKSLGLDLSSVAGAGAAGGLGAGLMLLGGKIEPGFQVMAGLLNLEAYFSEYDLDLVMTGEGQLNYQSQLGKVPVEVASMAKKYQKKVLGVFGEISLSNEAIFEAGIDSAFSITSGPISLKDCMENAENLLFEKVQNIFKMILVVGTK